MLKEQRTGFHLDAGAIAIVLLPLCATAGCAAHFETVDGYEAEYVEAPPPNIVVYPRYEISDGYVYEVHGRYYHRHGDRWVVYRSAPREVVREREYVQHAPPEHDRWR